MMTQIDDIYWTSLAYSLKLTPNLPYDMDSDHYKLKILDLLSE